MDESRLERIRNLFSGESIDALLVSDFYNILYVSGFRSLTTDEREAFVLLTKNNIYLFTDARYTSPSSDVILELLEPGKGLIYHLSSILQKEKINVLGIEAENLRVQEYFSLQRALPDVKLVNTRKFLSKIRAAKELKEIEDLEKACALTDECLREILPGIKAGESEKNIAWRLESWVRQQGYSPAFDPIVAVNEHSAVPHYDTGQGNGVVTERSVILVDFGIMYKNYRSDITRMVFFRPTEEMKKTYDSLLGIQKKTIEAISKTKEAKLLDQYCRKECKEAGFPLFSHSLGHGVGLEVHEFPKLSVSSSDMLQDGHVFTIEPGVYYADKWGMRIEDTVMLAGQNVRILTRYPKEIMILS